MSINVDGSEQRLLLRLPAEGEGWKRQGAEMVSAPLGGGDATGVVGPAGDTTTSVLSTGELRISANNDGSGTGQLLLVNSKTGDNFIALALDGNVNLRSGDSPARVSLQSSPAKLIAEHDGIGSAQMAHIATVDDAPKAIAFCEALRLYLIARGTMAAS